MKCTSSVNLKAADHQGCTVLHHLVKPLSYGCFENVRLLKALVDAGAAIDAKDHSGKTPLDLARQHGATKLTIALQKLAGNANPEALVRLGSS